MQEITQLTLTLVGGRQAFRTLQNSAGPGCFAYGISRHLQTGDRPAPNCASNRRNANDGFDNRPVDGNAIDAVMIPPPEDTPALEP
jgi:hypothetical protein